MSGAERAKRLRQRRPKGERAIANAVQVARRLQKVAGVPKSPRRSLPKWIVPGKLVSFATPDKPLCRYQGKVARLWQSDRRSEGDCAFVIIAWGRQDKR